MSSSKSLCREAPAGSGLRSIGDERPKSPPLAIWPGSSSPNSDEPPPRLSRIVSSPRKRCSTTSVEYFSTPCWSVHLRVCSWPSRYTLEPFFRYCSAMRARFSLKITTECHSVFSLRSPVPLSFQLSEVAIRRFTTGSPEFRRRTSGSRPRLPTKITLFTLPAIAALLIHLGCCGAGATKGQGIQRVLHRSVPTYRPRRPVTTSLWRAALQPWIRPEELQSPIDLYNNMAID